MTTKAQAPTPEQIDDQLVAAEAEHRRLADKAAAIREAGETTRAAVELRCVRDAHAALPKAAREARDQAAADLATSANAEILDHSALLAAFDRLQRLDAQCAAVSAFTSQLDRLDPLPERPNGAQQSRPPQCARLHRGATFSDYVDMLLHKRADAAEAERLKQLQDDLAKTVDAAEQAARQQAAELADGQCLEVDTPETIAEQFQQAIANVDDAQLDPETVRSAGLNTAGNVARARVLDTLVAQEAGG
jgi:hypothetical protein